MKRDSIDFFLVAPNQLEIHERLLNWARWVSVGRAPYQAPMWRQGKSSGRQWHVPVVRETVNTLDGLALEKAVGALPVPHREAIRWCYVYQTSPMQARRKLGVTAEGLMRLISDARLMLRNRGV